MTYKSLIRKVGISEGYSYLAFALTMPLKYSLGIPLPNKIVGILHGILFMAYSIIAILGFKYTSWKFKTVMLVFIASFIPFGTFVADKYLFKKLSDGKQK